MKTRTGFVSNSSSSSFVVIDRYGDLFKTNTLLHDVAVVLGETMFGWQVDDYYDWQTKANFCKIQASYFECPKKEIVEYMLDKVIMDHTGATIVEWNIDDGYIDHQSSATEGENVEMFDSEETLRDFLFRSGSYIHNDNDNH